MAVVAVFIDVLYAVIFETVCACAAEATNRTERTNIMTRMDFVSYNIG